MTEILIARSTDDWRAWLAGNGQTETEVWLVIQHKDSQAQGPRYAEAIEQALCFGWIDSNTRGHDAHSFRQRFTPRRPRSRWSAVNRERAARLTESGLMTEHGLAAIEQAKATGTWESATNT